VRVDMLRKDHTYELLITRHALGEPKNGSHPQLETTLLFRGIHGRIDLELWGKDKSRAGNVVPTFYSLAGEAIPIPETFLGVARAAVRGATCLRCVHSHYLRPRPSTTPVPLGERGEATVTPQAPNNAGDRKETSTSIGAETIAS
jgi:hypothetical protein